jgi:ribonuclease HI
MTSKILINADGGSRKNPGPAAIGIVLFNESREIIESYKEYIGITTNNVAEYNALKKSLQLASKQTSEEVHIFMDSELIVNQVKGMYKVKAINLQPLFEEVKSLEKNFKRIIYNYVPRTNEYQILADKLVNEALDGM